MPAAEFEAFRECSKTFHDRNPELEIYKVNDNQIAQNGLVVNESLTIKDRKSNDQLYRINLHLTSSIATINGKQLTLFMNQHLEIICNTMALMGNFVEANLIIKEACLELLKKVPNKNNEMTQNFKNKSCNNMSTDLIENNRQLEIGAGPNDFIMCSSTSQSNKGSESGASEENKECSVCGRVCIQESIFCDLCES